MLSRFRGEKPALAEPQVMPVESKTADVEMTDLESPGNGLDRLGGTRNDRKEMKRMGKKQELKRNFHFLSILGFTSCLMCTWEGILSVAYTGLIDGGIAGILYTFIFTIVGFTIIIASMSDMASMAPTSGGQYHWVSEFAPKSSQKFLSYIVGWLCALGWQCGTASTAYLSGTMIQGLIVLCNPDYTPTRWQGTLFLLAISLLGTFLNTYGARHLPTLEGIILVVHIFGFFAVLIPLWVMAPKNPASVVFTSFSNGGGWPNTGVACIVGQIAAIYSFIGPDSGVHMAEEVKDASKVIPWAMISTAVINSTLGLLMLIMFCFCLTDLESALGSSTGYPFIYVFYNATQSKAGTILMSMILIILLACASTSVLATASRQVFSFARDGGLPFSHVFARVNTKVGHELPLNAVIVSLGITVILALINLGSSAAFNSVVSIQISSLFTSYFISISCILIKRIKGEPLPPSRWSMGRFAIPMNILALMYIVFVFVMTLFPIALPVSPVNMNWGILIWGSVVMFAIGSYFVHGRKMYQGPVVMVNKSFDEDFSPIGKPTH